LGFDFAGIILVSSLAFTTGTTEGAASFFTGAFFGAGVGLAGYGAGGLGLGFDLAGIISVLVSFVSFLATTFNSGFFSSFFTAALISFFTSLVGSSTVV